jgi:hypothetical protein
VLSQQLPLNGVPDTQIGLSAGTPRRDHSRTSSRSSTRSNLSPPHNKSARSLPNPTTNPAVQTHSPPPRSVASIQSAIRSNPSSSRDFSSASISHSTSEPGVNHPNHPFDTPEPGLFDFWFSSAFRSNLYVAPGDAEGSGSNDDGEGTPRQQVSQSRSPLRNVSPPVLCRSPSELGCDDGGYSHSPTPSKSNGRTPTVQSQKQGTNHPASYRNQTGVISPTNPSQSVFPPVLCRSPSELGSDDSGYSRPHSHSGRTSAVQSPKQSEGGNNTALPQNWQAGVTSSTSQSQPGSPPLVIQDSSQQRQSESRVHTPWQGPPSPHPFSPPNVLHTYSSSPGSGRSPYATHTPTKQFSTHPRPPYTPHSKRGIPHGSAQTVFTPANGNGNVGVGIDSVVDDLLKVQPTSVVWQTSKGVLTWAPHPALPNSSPGLCGDGSGGGRAGTVDWLTGGSPTPGAWPPTTTPRRALIQLAPWMIPNPSNPALPHITWDISQSPATAKDSAGNVITDKLGDVATHPAVDRLVIACQAGVAEKLWGHIEVRASRPKGVTVWDVFNGIFEYFHKRVGRRRLDQMKEILGDELLEEKMAGAFHHRVGITPALPGCEPKEELRRVDCLGDVCIFWGLYVSYNEDDTWQLNLGLVNRRKRS